MPIMMPANLFVEVYGKYVPRLCVDTALIGPEDVCVGCGFNGQLEPNFRFIPKLGVALKERDEEPRLGQWGLPGGTMFKGEHPFDASARIIKNEFDAEITPLGSLGFMYFPNEARNMDVDGVATDFVIDSCSIVVLARAKTPVIHSRKGKYIGWFCETPPKEHDIHTPFLRQRGLLPPSTFENAVG